MSQQEFEKGSQSNQQNSSNEEDEIHQPQYPYSWSGKISPEGVPRDEPPSTYDATVMQQGYWEQTPNVTNAPGSQQAKAGNQYQYIPPADDGDAYEQGYRPHNAYNRNQSGQGPGVPPWARPQHHQRNPIRFAFIILVLLSVGVLMTILGSAGSILAFFLVMLFIILLPLLMLLVIFGIIFRIVRPRRTRYWYGRRGPWW